MKIVTLLFFAMLFLYSTAHAQYQLEWDKIFSAAPFSLNQSVGLGYDEAGFIYSAGYSVSSILAGIFIVKYTPDGDTVWTKTIGNDSSSNRTVDFIVDNNGSSYLLAYTDKNGNGNFLTMKLNSDGTIAWQKEFDYDSSGYDEPLSLSMDSQKNLYALGYYNNYSDLAVVKYDSAGNEEWVYLSETPNISEWPVKIVTDNLNNPVIITGASVSYYDIKVIKLNTSGDTLWTRTYDNSGFADFPNSVVIDANDNIVIGGYISTSPGIAKQNFAVLKYDPSGNLLWSEFYNGPQDLSDQVQAVAVDESGNIYAAGTSVDSLFLNTSVVIQYSSDGDSLWGYTYAGEELGRNESAAGDASVKGILYHSGHLLLFGTRFHEEVLMMFAIIFQTGNQNALALILLQYPEFEVYAEAALFYILTQKTQQAPEVIVNANRYSFMLPFPEIVTAKFSAGATSVEENSQVIEEYFLTQNYPNPFNPSTRIKYQVPEFGFVTLKVYDLLGNEIAVLVNEEKPAGNYEVDFNTLSSGNNLSSGIYFYKLTSGKFSETKKMTFLK